MNKDQKVYIKEDGVRFRKTPDISSAANIIRELSKGQELIFLESNGLWFKVHVGMEEGWVRGDYVSEVSLTPTQVIQQTLIFVKGQAYLAASEITKKVRAAIKDEFGLGKSVDTLNCTEYVMYRVKIRTGVTIQWPSDRPRNGGKWADIFERNKLYIIESEPQVNGAMCFTTGISSDQKINDIGHVAFVEEVLPDGSIKISEANWPNQGKYNERPISKAEWENKYKARFIRFV